MLELLFDPLTRGPFWASSLLALMLSMVGLTLFHAKKPLLAEVVSHCSYPGAMLGVLISVATNSLEGSLIIMLVSFVMAAGGFFALKKLERHVSEDSSMTLVLSSFFGLGILITSAIQQTAPKYYRLAQGYLFGQVSTMTDRHILIYALGLALTIAIYCLFSSRIKLRLFDPVQSSFLKQKWLDLILELLICLVIVLGIRGVGVVLVSSFFVAPAAFSLKWSRTFKGSLLLSVCFAFLMNVVAFFSQIKAPLGPLVVLLMSLGAVLSFKRMQYVHR